MFVCEIESTRRFIVAALGESPSQAKTNALRHFWNVMSHDDEILSITIFFEKK